MNRASSRRHEHIQTTSRLLGMAPPAGLGVVPPRLVAQGQRRGTGRQVRRGVPVAQGRKRAREQGVEALRTQPRPGGPATLTAEQRAQIPALWARGAAAAGARGDVWTAPPSAAVLCPPGAGRSPPPPTPPPPRSIPWASTPAGRPPPPGPRPPTRPAR